MCSMLLAGQLQLQVKNPDAGWQFLKESAYANDEMAKQTAICGMPSNKM